MKYPNLEYTLEICSDIQYKYDLPDKLIVKQYENYSILPFLQSKYPDIAQLKALINRSYVPDDKLYDELASQIYMFAKLVPEV
jgi:hypothetical protein